ncbi:hypothetical protein BC629DRAFT_1435036 [Irpex lacteus]|nr:hypothetical protein BC629DRAFT_1435036 [Irpex lacteus]
MAAKYGQKNKKLIRLTYLYYSTRCKNGNKNTTAAQTSASGSTTNTVGSPATRNRGQSRNSTTTTTTTTSSNHVAAAATATVHTPSNIPIDPQLLEHDRQQREVSATPAIQSSDPVPAAAPQPTSNTMLVTNTPGASAPVSGTSSTGGTSAQTAAPASNEPNVALLMERIRQLESQLGGQSSRAEGTASTTTARRLIPKPKGSAGGGSRGFHLQEAMGLSDDSPNGDGNSENQRRYNMILATVRELAHAARLDLSCPYRHVSPENLNKIFSMARKIHPYLSQFENDWATAEILKQYLSSVHRYGRRKGYFNQDARSRRGTLDNIFDNFNTTN